jgi:hypothetical protein
MHPAARLLQTSLCKCTIPRRRWSRTAQRANQPPKTSPCYRPLSKHARASLRRVASFEWKAPTHRAKNQTGRHTIAVSDLPVARRIVCRRGSPKLTRRRWNIFSDQLTRVKSQPSYSTRRRNNLLSQARTSRTILSKPDANLS